MKKRYLLFLSALLNWSSACSESSSPQVLSPTCGSFESPCAFPCGLDCASRVVDVAATCMITLQGTLDGTRTRCSFLDKSSVVFGQSVPLTPSLSTTWDLTLYKKDEVCLSVQSTPAIQGAANLTVTTAKGTYRQEVSPPSPLDGGAQDHRVPDALPPDQGRRDANPLDGRAWDMGMDRGPDQRVPLPPSFGLRQQCPEGKSYSAETVAGCIPCGDGGCTKPTLLELRVTTQNSFQFSLAQGDRVTPLFTCR